MTSKFKSNKINILIIAAVILLFTTVAAFAEENVVITGFSTGNLSFSVADLKKLPATTQEVVSVNSAGNEKKFTITGPTLADLLNTYGKSQTSLEAIRLIAGDGYSIEVPGEVLKSRQIILAYMMDGAPLDEKTKPVRVIIPEERAMYWIRNLAQIEVLGVVEEAPAEKIVFLETAVAQVEAVDYTYYESVDQAVQVGALLKSLGITDSKSVSLQALDGLKKNENQEIFSNGYIKITGKDTPLFLSPDLPKGMHVKQILYFTSADAVVVSLTRGLEGLEKITLDGTTGVKVATLVNTLGLVKTETYRLIANDGYTAEVAYADLANGIVYLDEKGRVRSYFTGLPKNTGVKGLLTIEAVK